MSKCPSCHGGGKVYTDKYQAESGYSPTYPCPTCEGTGEVISEVEAYKDQLVKGIDQLFDWVNEETIIFENGEEADKFQALLKLLIGGELYEADGEFIKFTKEGISIIRESKGGKDGKKNNR